MLHLTTPFDSDALSKLRIGDTVLLSGVIYTARDAAHEKIRQTLQAGQKPPIELAGQTIFYAGPCPAKPGNAIGSIAATTSLRMDRYVQMMFDLGIRAMIGKGDRGDEVAELCRQYGGVYFLGVGGAAALISSNVKRMDVVAYDELGTESIKRLEIQDMFAVVGIDSQGDVLQKREIPKYRIEE